LIESENGEEISNDIIDSHMSYCLSLN